MTATLRQDERVKYGAEFRRARDAGRRMTGRLMLLNVLCAQDLVRRRLGVVTSRKLGGAVVRNRARRLVREAWRLIKDRLVDSCDVVVVARRSMVGKGMAEVQAELLFLLRKAGVLKAS